MESNKSKGGMSNYELATLIKKLREDSDVQKLVRDFEAISDDKNAIVLNLIDALKVKE